MRKSDIQSLGDIARLILENAAGAENLNNTANHLYDKLKQKLRLNDFMDGSKPIVMFYTMKISDTENDVLHNASGPAIVFANDQGVYDESDPELAFYFLNDKRVEVTDKEWKVATHELKYRSNKQDLTGKTDGDTPAGKKTDEDDDLAVMY